MPGESILVVDDSVVNLKLAAAVLRSDGYKVHLASTAEQALVMLRTMLPDLMLVDIQLPGMSGLELTRHVRQDSRTQGMLVVALTASIQSDAQQNAFDAGCDGFLSKPIDTRTLGQRLRTFLDGQSLPASPDIDFGTLPAGLSFSGSEMEGLRRGFLADGTRMVRRMLEFVDSQVDTAEARGLFHQWVGSAGALGYMEIAEHARAADNLLSGPAWTRQALREVLTALALAFASPREATATPIPDAIAQGLNGKRIALIGFADEEADRVCEAFAKVRALPRLFAGDEPPDAHSIRDCSVLMVHVRPETIGVPWLQADFPPSQPLVLVGVRDDLLALPAKVQSRACEFLIDGWQPEEAIMRLSFALARALPGSPEVGTVPAAAESPGVAYTGRPEIVIADDDLHVLAVVRNTLQSLGMECRSASSGPEALTLIRELCPHAAVLDVNMPGMDGFEVLAGIRQSGLPVKVIMLTARQQERDILRGFELGADDYLVKPFNPLELAARLRRLLQAV
jgi:CheY-like chemotaxis protein